MKLINEKEVKERIKCEYQVDKKLTIEYVKDMLNKLINLKQYEFRLIELSDDCNLFDGGTRKSCSEENQLIDFINQKLDDEIISITIFGKYNDIDISISFVIDEDRVRTSCKEKFDANEILKLIEN